MFWGSGWSAAGGLTMMIGMIALVALVVVGVVLLFRPVFGRKEAPRDDMDMTRACRLLGGMLSTAGMPGARSPWSIPCSTT